MDKTYPESSLDMIEWITDLSHPSCKDRALMAQHILIDGNKF